MPIANPMIDQRKANERPCYDEISGEYLLDLILADYAPQHTETPSLLDEVVEKTTKKLSAKVAKRTAKKSKGEGRKGQTSGGA